MKRRALLTGATAMPLLSGCFWDRHFDLSWEEEVQLHDGRVIVVKLKHTYERLHREFTRYGGTNLTRDTTLTFDAGGTAGTVTQLFKGFHPKFIGQHEGVWYVLIYGSHYYKSNEIPSQNWGIAWYDCDRAAVLKGVGFVPISVHDFPMVFQKQNMLLLYGTAAEHAEFNGKRITLKEKAAWRIKHPPGYGDDVICRPPKSAIKPTDIFNLTPAQGEKK